MKIDKFYKDKTGVLIPIKMTPINVHDLVCHDDIGVLISSHLDYKQAAMLLKSRDTQGSSIKHVHIGDSIPTFVSNKLALFWNSYIKKNPNVVVQGEFEGVLYMMCFFDSVDDIGVKVNVYVDQGNISIMYTTTNNTLVIFEGAVDQSNKSNKSNQSNQSIQRLLTRVFTIDYVFSESFKFVQVENVQNHTLKVKKNYHTHRNCYDFSCNFMGFNANLYLQKTKIGDISSLLHVTSQNHPYNPYSLTNTIDIVGTSLPIDYLENMHMIVTGFRVYMQSMSNTDFNVMSQLLYTTERQIKIAIRKAL